LFEENGKHLAFSFIKILIVIVTELVNTFTLGPIAGLLARKGLLNQGYQMEQNRESFKVDRVEINREKIFKE
jgi:hypothetical protein